MALTERQRAIVSFILERTRAGRDNDIHPTHDAMSTEIPSFLLRPGDIDPRTGKEIPARGDMKARTPPIRGHGCFRMGWVFLVESVDVTQPDDAAIIGFRRPQGQLAGIDVGTVLFHCPRVRGIPPVRWPWQTGRVHLDGVRWEEKTWPRDDFRAFRDHLASLMEFTVPGDVRPQSRNLPVVSDIA